MPDADVLKKSVTANDYADQPGGGVYLFAVTAWPTVDTALPPDLHGLSLRDADIVLTSTIDQESMWAGAVSIAITKVASLSWEVQGDIPLRVKRGQELLQAFDAGRGWVCGISKVLQDFLLTNNGTFIEIVRQSGSLNSQIIGLIPLDSLRCTRTGDPERPVVFRDLKGREHQLQSYEVMDFADMPSNRASMFGSGKCAAHRAYKSIYKLSSIETYLGEKVTGRHPTVVHFIHGLNDLQLRSILSTAQSDADARGAIAYMGAILATVPAGNEVSTASVPLTEFPDNFDRQKETDIAILAFANNLGLDVQDIQPLTGRALGTGAQSEVLDSKAKGKGLMAFRQQFTHGLSQWVLPDLTTFLFVEKDWRDKNLTADYNQKVETYVSDSVQQGIIDGPKGLQLLVDENIYPKEFLPVDTTPDTNLSDEEKPDMGVEVPTITPPPSETPPAPTPTEPVIVPPVTKERPSLSELMRQEEEAALALVEKIGVNHHA